MRVPELSIYSFADANNLSVDSFAKANKLEFQVLPRQNKTMLLHDVATNANPHSHYAQFAFFRPRNTPQTARFEVNQKGNSLMKAIIVQRHGGADVLEHLDLPEPAGASSEVIVDLHFAGVNFVDIYQREGRYPGVTLPLRLGIEGSGIVRHAPSGSDWHVGDRVAFCTGASGSYAEQISVPSAHLVRVPAAVSLATAAAVLEQGLTATILADEVMAASARVALVHAAAGGVGGLLTQLLLRKGLRVLGTVSTTAKADWLTACGAEPIDYGAGADWLAQVRDKTAGKGVDVVFDSVGADTIDASFDALTARGHVVLFGSASGQVPTVEIAKLMRKSASLTRPVLPHFLADAQTLRRHAGALFEQVTNAALEVRVHATLPLAQAAQAHALLASRGTQGKLLLAISRAAKAAI
jgi:NADPH:quinone reductase